MRKRSNEAGQLLTPVKIRKMDRKDVPRVMEIERECFSMPWQESAYYTELANRCAYYIVAETDDTIVGFAGMWIIMDEAHITTIGVARDFRGQSIGEQLLLGLLSQSLTQGAKRATLEVRQSNVTAQRLYEKYCFTPAAVRRGYYTDNDENAIVMWVDDMHSETFQSKVEEFGQKLERARTGPRLEELC